MLGKKIHPSVYYHRYIMILIKVAPYSFEQNTVESTLTLIYLIISCLWNVLR